LRGGMGEYTKDYIQLTKDYTHEGRLFDSLRDPVTRWFFKPARDVDEAINEFVEKDEFINVPDIIGKTQENNKLVKRKQKKNKKSKDYDRDSITVVSRATGGKRRNKNVIDKDDPIKQLLSDTENPLIVS